MNFELHPAAAAAHDRALACARDVVAPAAAEIDRTGRLPDAVRQAAGAVLPAEPHLDPVAWVAAVEALAAASAATAVAAAGAVLGALADATTGAQWPGLRGADADGLRAALAGDARWDLAVTAVLIGLGRAALEQSRTALRAARADGVPNESAQSALADAATAVDAARLLLWQAASALGPAAPAARGMARLQALDAAPLAVTAAERATDADASRPGAALERIARDAATVARVLGEAATAHDAVAAATLPG